jgi:hypothetical protein
MKREQSMDSELVQSMQLYDVFKSKPKNFHWTFNDKDYSCVLSMNGYEEACITMMACDLSKKYTSTFNL